MLKEKEWRHRLEKLKTVRNLKQKASDKASKTEKEISNIKKQEIVNAVVISLNNE